MSMWSTAGRAPGGVAAGGGRTAPDILVAGTANPMRGAAATIDLPALPDGHKYLHLELRAWSWYGTDPAAPADEGFLRGLYHRDGAVQASWYHGRNSKNSWYSGGNHSSDSITTYAVGILWRRAGGGDSDGYTLEFDPAANRLSFALFTAAAKNLGRSPNLGDLLVTGYSGPP